MQISVYEIEQKVLMHECITDGSHDRENCVP